MVPKSALKVLDHARVQFNRGNARAGVQHPLRQVARPRPDLQHSLPWPQPRRLHNAVQNGILGQDVLAKPLAEADRHESAKVAATLHEPDRVRWSSAESSPCANGFKLGLTGSRVPRGGCWDAAADHGHAAKRPPAPASRTGPQVECGQSGADPRGNSRHTKRREAGAGRLWRALRHAAFHRQRFAEGLPSLTESAPRRRRGSEGSGDRACESIHVRCGRAMSAVGRGDRQAVEVANATSSTARQAGDLSFPDLNATGGASLPPASPSGLRPSAVSRTQPRHHTVHAFRISRPIGRLRARRRCEDLPPQARCPPLLQSAPRSRRRRTRSVWRRRGPR